MTQTASKTEPTAFPLTWPIGFPRTTSRERGAFKTTLAGALRNVSESLKRFAADSKRPLSGVVISSNVTLGADKPTDPGVAIWFVWDGIQACIPVDRYLTVEANLQAIHHVLEARRVEIRHGTLPLVRAVMSGLAALPAPARAWAAVFGVSAHASTDDVRQAYRRAASVAHPDKGGSDARMAEVNAAWAAFQRERGLA